MKKYVLILLFINVTVVAYGIFNARMELPNLENDFKEAEESIARLEPETPKEQFMASVFQANLNRVKSSSSIVIREYKGYEILFPLTLLNIVGLFFVLFTKKAEQGGSSKPLPPTAPEAG